MVIPYSDVEYKIVKKSTIYNIHVITFDAKSDASQICLD